MTPIPTPTCDVLVTAASNGQGLLLAERFAAAAREQGQSAEVLDLTAIDLPLFTSRAQAAGTPAALAALQARQSRRPALGDPRAERQRLDPACAHQRQRLTVGARR